MSYVFKKSVFKSGVFQSGIFKSLLPKSSLTFAFLLPATISMAQTQPGSTNMGSTGSPTFLSGETSLFAGNRGNTFNPSIGANALFLYTNSSEGNLATSDEPNGLSVQELELMFSSDVDPYTRLAILLSVHPEREYDVATNRRLAPEYHLDPEEAYVETISLPYVTLKAGKFRAALGKHNQLHTHAFPFIDAPLLQTALLGDEGLNDVGVSASTLVPVPWYMEFVAQAVRGDAEGIYYFNSRSSNDVVALGRLRNLWDLSDSSTIELGLSGATGNNDLEASTRFLGADLTFKWRPVEGGKYQALVWSTEALQRVINENGGAKNDGVGLATYFQYQFARRWWAQARAEWLKSEDKGAVATPSVLPERTNKWSALVGFFPSEYSGVRLQYDNIDESGRPENENRVMIQLNFSIGAHPAHTY